MLQTTEMAVEWRHGPKLLSRSVEGATGYHKDTWSKMKNIGPVA